MIKNTLQTKEKVIYKILENQFIKNTYSHLFLLVGKNITLIKETAYLIAQSIIESNNNFACQICSTCKNIRNNNYPDLIYIDGSQTSIKKDDIESLMEQFLQSSISTVNKKVFIIENISNSSSKVLNMMLKFIEEPKGNTYAIFIDEDETKVLQTIRSRSLILKFKDDGLKDIEEIYKSLNLNNLESKVASFTHKKFIEDINIDILKDSISLTKEFIESLSDKYKSQHIFYLYTLKFKSEDLNLLISYFLNTLQIIIKYEFDNELQDYKNLINQYGQSKLLKIVLEANKKLNLNIDKKYILDEIALKIING